MTPETRRIYFRLWIDACTAAGWDNRDDDRRQAVTLECMAAVRGPLVRSSHPEFGPDETTALFTYLEFLAHPEDLDRSARWADCQTDYHAFNRARQADWHEGKAYGQGGSRKLQRERFGGERSAVGGALEPFNPKKIYARHLTAASRHRKKARVLKKVAALIEDPAERARLADATSAGRDLGAQAAKGMPVAPTESNRLQHAQVRQGDSGEVPF